MVTGNISGLFATTVGGVPKPEVDSIIVGKLGVKDEIIRDTKHHGGEQKAVCILAEEIVQDLQERGHPIAGGTTGENILLSVPFEVLQPGVVLEFDEAVLEITMAATPCKTIAESFLNQEFTLLSDKRHPGRTRWYARVQVEGIIKNGENVAINSNA